MNKKPIVIDNGTSTCFAGFAGGVSPEAVVPTNLGGKSPIDRGIINNWDDMEKIWDRVYRRELKAAPEDHTLLMTDVVLNPEVNRSKMTEIAFEKFHVPAFYVVPQPVLALYAMGQTTGIVCDSGAGVTQFVPIQDGYAVADTMKKIDFGGSDLTNFFQKLLRDKGRSLPPATDRNVVRAMKETLCRVAPKTEVPKETGCLARSYELPDGEIVTVGSEMTMCPEALFNPSLAGCNCDGLAQQINNAIAKCSPNIQPTMYENIMLCGGNTLFPGIDDRLLAEMQSLAPASTKVKVTAPTSRLHSVWIGGSILASLVTFQDMWITKKDYEDCGSAIVHKKCLVSKQ